MKSLFLIVFIAGSLFGQGVEVIYEAKALYPEEVLKVAPAIANMDVMYRYKLQINDNKSVFNKESFYVKKMDGQMGGGIMAETIYKDFSNNVVITSSVKYKEGKCLGETIDDWKDKSVHTNKWELSDEEKTISGISCKKATRGSTTVWYSTNHSFQDGPGNVIYPVPGLVLEVINPGYHYVAIDFKEFDGEIVMPANLDRSENEAEITSDYLSTNYLGGKDNCMSFKEAPVGTWVSLNKR